MVCAKIKKVTEELGVLHACEGHGFLVNFRTICDAHSGTSTKGHLQVENP